MSTEQPTASMAPQARDDVQSMRTQMPEESLSTATRRRRWVFLLVALALTGGAYALSMRSHDVPARDAGHGGRGPLPPVPVLAEPVRVGDIPVYLDGIGAVTPLATVTVKSRVDGQLMTVLFREGQVVHAGDLLAEIDPRPFQVQLEQAQGQMARDQALLANAKVDLERYRRLVATDSIPKQQLDTQQALVRQYEGAIEADQAQVDNAKLQLVYSRITAPISGRLGLRLVDPGNIVHANDAGGLVVITEVQPIAVVFTIPEDSVPRVMQRLNAGEQLQVEAYDRERRERLAAGTLLTVDNAIDPNTGTLRLKAEFPNEDGALFPNQFVNARLVLNVRRNAALVPTVAIQRGNQGTFVYVVKDDHRVEVRPVKTGVSAGDNTSVENGLAPGELVVVDGTDGLTAGRTVTLQRPSATTSAEAHP
jgi:membrane fusion protein, multidrug efflux system